MELPEIFESRGFPDGIPGKGCTSFCSAVVHDGHAPSLLTGHINKISLSEVRSPKSRMRNLPNVKRVPSDRGFSPDSVAGCSAVLQAAFAAPTPGRGCSITAPSELITLVSIPCKGKVSPGLAVVRLSFC